MTDQTVTPDEQKKTTATKAILAFLSLAVTNLLVNWTSGGTPLPTDGGTLDVWALVANILTTLGGTAAVYRWPNKDKEPAATVVEESSGGRHEA